MLGNAVISKKFLRSRKIYLGYAYQGEGRVCPCTLVDRKQKRFNNAVDVVERFCDPTDPSTERMTPPRSAHVQLDDVPRALDPVEDEGEFRQHDGVATVMMMLPTQGFA